LHTNDKNPRFIKTKRFKDLKRSILKFPKMMAKRPITALKEQDGKIIGGNMRYLACVANGMTELPVEWVQWADDFTPEEIERFIAVDNEGFGDWDLEILANLYDMENLLDWGIELPDIKTPMDPKEPEQKVKWVPDCVYPSNNMWDIPTLLDMAATELDLPFIPWGVKKRSTTKVGTYHFYVDDYRFENIWNEPNKIVDSNCINIVEPNCSLHELTPLSYGVFLIYKKRWIARYLQSFNINVFVDLNVHPKFIEYNNLGVPEGWNAFATRGMSNDLKGLKRDIETAKQISGLNEPYMIVYGGGKKCKELAVKNNLVFIDSQLELS